MMEDEKTVWHPMSVKIEWNIWAEFRRIVRAKGLGVSGVIKSLVSDYVDKNR